MGKLTSSDVTTLVEAGVISKSTEASIVKKGVMSERTKTHVRYMQTKDGKWVSPTLYWRGGRKTEYSDNMIEFRDKFNDLLNEYTTVRENK
tara:strand:- start:535 stop:807 length:273 start_codon:yes stop_codon:yes gene_type:complete